MEPIKSIARQFSSRIRLCFMLSIISLVFCDPNFVSSAETYYYLHVSSHRLKMRAVRDVARLQNKGYNTISRRERVPNKGYWYRVYIGPFSSLQEAKLKRKELRTKKLVEYVAIHKKESLISVDLEERKTPIEVEKVVTPAVPEEPVEVLPAPEKPPAAKEVPAPIPSMEEPEEVKAPPPIAPTRPPARISAKPPRKIVEMAPKGSGRNMGRGDFSLGLRHTYRKVETEITKRKRITSDGTTTTTENVSVTSAEKEDFTSLHMDSVLVRFGLTNYLEVFAEIGGAYREFSDSELTYGGGLRLNLFEVKGGWLRGFYGGLQGEYLAGAVSYEYSSSVGGKWKKEADWQEFLAKGELGVARSRFTAYLGAAYLHYREDTERQLLKNLPSSLTSYVFQDELEQESFGAYGGGVIHLSPAFLLNIEGQVFSQKSIFGALEYHF